MTRKVKILEPDGVVQEYVDGGEVDLDAEVVLNARGERVDEAYVAAAVREIEDRPRGGRPSLSQRPGASKVVRGRVSDSLHAAFVRRAKAEHKSESDVLRDALKAYLGHAE